MGQYYPTLLRPTRCAGGGVVVVVGGITAVGCLWLAASLSRHLYGQHSPRRPSL